MTKTLDVFRHEWTLLMRGKAAPLLWIVFAGFWMFTIVSYEMDPAGRGLRGYVFYNMLYWVSMSIMLLCALAAARLAGKDRSDGMQRMILSWNVSNAEWLAGKWLALQVYGQLFTLLAIGFQWGWFAWSGSASMIYGFAHAAYTAMQLGCGLFFMISFGFVLAMLLRGRIVYLVLPLLWMAPVTIELQGGTPTPNLETIWRWFSPYGLTGYKNIEFRNIWEIPHLAPAAWHQLPLVLASVFLFLLGLLLFERHRSGFRQRMRYLAATVGTGVICAGALSAGFLEFDNRIARQRAQISAYSMPDQPHAQLYEQKVPVTDFVPETVKLALRFPKRDALAVTADVTVRNTSSGDAETVKFTLNRSLELRSLEADRPVGWSRDGDVVIVTAVKPLAGGENLRITMEYDGDIAEYREEGLLKYSFASRSMLNLPKSIAWYPLIGERMLLRKADHNGSAIGYIDVNAPYIEPGPAVYEVTIEDGSYPEAVLPIPRTAAGHYKGTTNYGLFMAAGSLAETSVEGIRVVDHPDLIEAAAEEVRNRLEQHRFIESWLGERKRLPNLYANVFTYQENDWSYEGSDAEWTYLGADVPKIDAGDELTRMLNWLLGWCLGKRFDYPYARNYDTFEAYYLEPANRKPDERQRQLLDMIAQREKQGFEPLLQMAADLYKAYRAAGSPKTFDLNLAWRRIGGNAGEDSPGGGL
jgi:hypothetical protein